MAASGVVDGWVHWHSTNQADAKQVEQMHEAQTGVCRSSILADQLEHCCSSQADCGQGLWLEHELYPQWVTCGQFVAGECGRNMSSSGDWCAQTWTDYCQLELPDPVQVDDLAKLAVNLDTSEEPMFFKDLKPSISEHLTNLWQNRWSQSSPNKFLEIVPDLKSWKVPLLQQTRKDEVIMCRSNHKFLYK